MRPHDRTAVGQRGEGGGQLERRDLRGAQRQRRYGLELTLDAGAPDRLHHAIEAGEHGDADGRDVQRHLERVPRRDRAAKLVVVVGRTPGLRTRLELDR